MPQTTSNNKFDSGLGLDVVFPTPGEVMRQRMMSH